MLLSGLLITGIVISLGRLAYKRRYKASQPAPLLQPRDSLSHANSLRAAPYNDAGGLINHLKHRITSFVLVGDREQQFRVISSAPHEIELSDAEKRLNRYAKISVSSLGFAALGILVYPALSLISVAGLIYVSIPFFRGTYETLIKERQVKIVLMDAILSIWCFVTRHYVPWALVCTLIYSGQIILRKTEDRSRKSLIDIFGARTSAVWVQRNGGEVEIPLEDIQIGDTVVVGAGEVIPIDGTIVAGAASIDQHILTGEAQPVERDRDDQVFASNVVLTGRIEIKVEKAGLETTAAQIAAILDNTADYKLAIESRGQTFADNFVLPTLGLAAIGWFVVGPGGAMAIANACFGYYLRVIAPIGMLNFLNLASQRGILIKDGRVLDLLSEVDTIVFDKTGTLTEEQPHVARILRYAAYAENDILTFAAAAEVKQTHPIARAILQEARARQLSLPEIEDAEYVVGYGLTVTIDNQLIYVGSARFLESREVAMPSEARTYLASCYLEGISLVFIAIDRQVVGAIEMHATVRPEAKTIVDGLKRHYGSSIYIISGDHEAPTKRLADELGIERYFAETSPQNKALIIDGLKEEGRSVCFVGDGINDSIALKTAQVSISLRGASTIATDTAQVIFMDATLNQLAALFDMANDFDMNFKRTIVLTMIPSTINVFGAFFWNFALIHTVILNEVGFLSGFVNAFLPLEQYRSKNLPQNSDLFKNNNL